MKHIKEKCDAYMAALPPGFTPKTRLFLEETFFAGAIGAYAIVSETPEEKAEEVMAEIVEETLEHLDKLRKNNGGCNGSNNSES